ncbi:MAG TPA: hypothetical protein VGF69_07130 [Thermoanaerobaculia bacterium]
MARGWESKSVESQIADRNERPQKREKWSSEQMDTARKRESLELSRTRIQRELAETSSPARRKALEAALAHLDDELRRF